MLKKMVDGVEIILSDEEERLTRAYWALNAADPDYSAACAWDGVNEPYYDMECAKQVHANLIEMERIKEYEKVCSDIEIAQENGESCAELFQKRKRIREYQIPSTDSCQSLADLKAIKFEV